MIKFIEQEPVRFVAAIQTTIAVAIVVANWLGGVEVPVEVIGAVEMCVAAWLAFVTRENVSPV